MTNTIAYYDKAQLRL